MYIGYSNSKYHLIPPWRIVKGLKSYIYYNTGWYKHNHISAAKFEAKIWRMYEA